MEFTINPGNVNQVPEGTCLAEKGTPVNAVFMVLKGHLLIENDSCCITAGAGSFVGLSDLATGIFGSTVVAGEECSVYAFVPAKQNPELQILTTKKDYAGIAVWTEAKAIYDYERLASELINRTNGLSAYIKEKYAEYSALSKADGFNPTEIRTAESIGSYEVREVEDWELLNCYLSLVKQPIDKCKDFYNDSEAFAVRHIREEHALVEELRGICLESAKYLEQAMYVLMNGTNENLYMCTAELIGREKGLGHDTDKTEELLNSVKDTILELEIFFEQSLHTKADIDLERMENAYFDALAGKTYAKPENEKPEKPDAEAIAILRKSLAKGAAQLVGYAGWGDEAGAKFISSIEKFVSLTNRMSTDEPVRLLKREISKQFFDLYMDVFLKTIDDSKVPSIVDLFLNYGFVDERLLNDEQLADLCSLKNDRPSAPCLVYTFREWLALVYKMSRTPSKSEMDLDLEESLRERKKNGELTDEDIKRIASDPVQWVSYEVHNMFTSTDRLLNGQVSTFVPVLYEDSFNGIPSAARITKDRINALVALLMVNDPTVFHREIMYNNAEAKIERETVVKCVYPEFILMPVNGSNILMWQDTSSRRRDSAGRFIVPIFFEGNPEDAMLKAFGRFRWEICKTIQSVAWNNPQVKSLTSEYYDYIEFYRKNHDLSEERKEKIKNQLTKARNNLREVFVQDYESWIKYEASGAVRLNKIAREIFATYIPFSAKTRAEIAGQPIFSDAMGRFDRNLKKKIYDLDLHYKNLEKNGATITSDMKDTIDYYKNL